MPATSKKQRRLFGTVYAYMKAKEKGEGSEFLNKLPDDFAKKVKKLSKDMSEKDVEHFASTKEKNLPKKVNECIIIKFDVFTASDICANDDTVTDDDNIVNDDKPTFTNIPIRKFVRKGGQADNISTTDLNQDDLKKGREIQGEHTDDPDIATAIAMDHLAEHPLYYDDEHGLPAMEKELDKIENKEEPKGETGKAYDDNDEPMLVQKNESLIIKFNNFKK